MTLEELYAEAIETERLWNYYSNDYAYAKTRIEFAYSKLNSYSDCKGFIDAYLHRGGKGDIPYAKNLEDLLPNRVKHIVSCFFLGSIFYIKCLRISNSIENSLQITRTTESPSRHFSYLWFLTCLFHDLGYAVEDHKSTSKKENDMYKDYLKELPRRPNGIPTLYTKKTLKSYSLLRACLHSCYDHGIVGGIALYHDLCNYRRQVVETFEKIHDGLYWGEELEKDFDFASWVITCHNIWMTNEHSKDVAAYKFFGLNALIIKDSYQAKLKYPISSGKNPFLFLFCLVDSIEPIKVMESTDNFPKIDIVFDPSDVKLNLSKLPTNLRKKYAKKILDLDSWLTPVISNDSNPDEYKIRL